MHQAVFSWLGRPSFGSTTPFPAFHIHFYTILISTLFIFILFI